MMERALQRIRTKLARLRETPRVGAREPAHGYELGPPVTDDAMARFEARHGVRLPEPYRRFLLEVGEAGAGPGYGLLPLARWDEAWADEIGDATRPSPSRPSPRPASWSLDPAALSAAMDGAITVCDHGARGFWLLEITGEERGRLRLWEDLEEAPTRSPEPDFLSWYEAWLDESIAGLDDRLFGVHRGGNDVDLILRLASGDAGGRAEAAAELGRRRDPSPAVIAALREAFRDPAPEVRATALRSGEPVAGAADVLLALDDAEADVRRAGAFLLRRLPARPDTEALLPRLARADDPVVLSVIALTLAERDALEVEALTALDAEDPALRARAHHALALATPRDRAVARAMAGLADPAPEVRAASATALAGVADARDALLALREGEREDTVRDAIDRALGD